MKKIKYLAILLGMILFAGGCSCDKEACSFPEEEIREVVEEYATTLSGHANLYSQTVESVVEIRIQNKTNYAVESTGSGVVVFEEGTHAYIITNAHVINEASKNNNLEIEVFFSTDKGVKSGYSEKATIAGINKYEDVGVLEISKSDKYKLAIIGNSDLVTKGEYVYTIGSPFGIFNYTTVGSISTYNYPAKIDNCKTGISTTVYAILTDADINEGNSGGGMFNSRGELIGITTWKYTDMEGIYGVLPINHFMKVARTIRAISYERPSLNVTLISINEMGTLKESYGISENITKGVYIKNSAVTNLTEESVIVELDDKPVNTVEEFMVELLKHDKGDNVRITLISKLDGQNRRTITVTLG